MALIKCSKCGKEISSNSKVCIHCKAPVVVDKNTEKVVIDYEAEKVINSLNTVSTTLEAILILLGIVTIIVSISSELYVLILAGIVAIIVGVISPIFIRWKALVLKNIYEINRRGNK